MQQVKVTDLRPICIKPNCGGRELEDLENKENPAKKCKKCGIISVIFHNTL